MEPRWQRPKFFNPFTEVAKVTPYRQWFKGFFRAMPLHRWSLRHAEEVLEFCAQRPSLFGLPDRPTCIVNTAHFLPSNRSKTAGVWVFGTERGCKSLVIPRSMSSEMFDTMDAKLVESIFRWNPGMEYLYLSRSCQPMYLEILPHLSRLRNLTRITLEGWDDAVAIHKVGMMCKSLEVIDTYTFDESRPDWHREVSVQAITTLIEMHPKLRSVEGSRNFLEAWFVATKYSRCKHNIALCPATCGFSVCYMAIFTIAMLVVSCGAYRLYVELLSRIPGVHYSAAVFIGFFASIATFVLLLVDDHINRHRRGRAWMQVAKVAVLAQRRWALRARGPSALAVAGTGAARGAASPSVQPPRPRK